jgi:hypothetical protein
VKGKKFIILVLLILSMLGIVYFTGCRAQNNAPVITGLYTESNSLPEGQNASVVAMASDPDGDAITYEWFVPKGRISGEGSRVTWTAPATPGAYTISVAVADGSGVEATMTITLSVMPNNLPVIISLEAEDTGCRRRDPVAVDSIAYDHDGDELSYEWIVTGGEIEGDGPFVLWIAPDELGTYTITSRVSDGKSEAVEDSLEIEVTGG